MVSNLQTFVCAARLIVRVCCVSVVQTAQYRKYKLIHSQALTKGSNPVKLMR